MPAMNLVVESAGVSSFAAELENVFLGTKYVTVRILVEMARMNLAVFP
jgi:hypothetical protein